MNRVSEGTILRRVMRAMSDAGARMFRNNVGALKTEDGRMVRYGVCNPGGSDLIGWRSRVIDEYDLGKTIAQFVACEVKAADGVLTHEQRQFLEVVRDSGGIAILARTSDEAISKLNNGGGI